jgi:hypothetical protein
MSSPDKIKAIVLTCDSIPSDNAAFNRSVQRVWPDHPFVFHIPYQELGGADSERIK